jgi:hypothetical protein
VFKITADDILALAKSLTGRTLKTLDQGKLFRVSKVEDDTIWYKVLSSNKKYSHPKRLLEGICQDFCKIKSLKTTDFKRGNSTLRCHPYTITLLVLYLAEAARPARKPAKRTVDPPSA